jgi:hypothetical protein
MSLLARIHRERFWRARLFASQNVCQNLFGLVVPKRLRRRNVEMGYFNPLKNIVTLGAKSYSVPDIQNLLRVTEDRVDVVGLYLLGTTAGSALVAILFVDCLSPQAIVASNLKS